MSQLKIIKASAGSGKTFSLAGAYLRLVITEPPDYFRHILAVTFTNKATFEMKDRIVSELNKLAYGQKSDHLNFLIKSTRMTEEAIRSKALIVMERILHGYSWFKVETIDSFFQGIIRNFIRELNIPGYYTIELDQEKVLIEALDRFLASIGENPKVTEWLVEYIESQIENAKSWDIEKGLITLGKHLFQEEIIDNLPVIQPFIDDTERMKGYSDRLLSIIRTFETRLLKEARQALDTISSTGFTDKDFYYSGSGTISYLRQITRKKFTLPGSRFQTLLEDPSKWPSKDCTRKQEAEKLGTEVINKAIEAIAAIYIKESQYYWTAYAIRRNLHLLGMLSYLSKHLSDVKNEKSLFLISDASPFIRRIINNNDTPFIYEKAGNHFHHLLIDEFQDTSKMQWENFKPLISNSLSQNQECLLVGDVKQAIYRWRNSKWEIMANQVRSEFPEDNIYESSLKINWRSEAQIVWLNNLLFQHIPKICEENFSGVSTDTSISSLYSEVNQEIPEWKKQRREGYVNIRFFNNDKNTSESETVTPELIIRINEVLQAGFPPGDIAILVRDKKDGTALSDILIKANKEKSFIREVGVISNESLFLKQSPAVNLLVAAMQFVYDPTDKLNAANLLAAYLHINTGVTSVGPGFSIGKFTSEALNQYIQHDFIQICQGLQNEGLYNLAEKLSEILGLKKLSEEKVYLHSFLDLVFGFSTSELSDIKSFIDFWNKEGRDKAISCSETPGSIRIITIHKSKGLEFPVVILPFADWSLSPKPNDIQWVVPTSGPFNELPLVPVNYTNAMADSIFSEEYKLEKLHTLIDNINLLYVALTRAENALIVMAKLSKDSVKNAGDLLNKALQQVIQSGELEELKHNTVESRYTLGRPVYLKQTEKSQPPIEIAEDQSDPKKINVRISAQLFPVSSEIKANVILYGKVLHSILEKIKVLTDLPNAVNHFHLSGILTKEETTEAESILKKALTNPLAAAWFSEQNLNLTETEIIGISGQIRRPDRVVISGDKATVVDYKTGDHDQLESHKKQVHGYMNLIGKMGYKKVQGYIWYVLENEIVEVEE